MQIDYNKLEDFRSILIANKIESYNSVISYYKNSYLPELREYSMFSQSEYLERYEKERKDFIADAKAGIPLKNLRIQPSEVMNFLRGEAISQRERAKDFSTNIYLVMRSLRACVKICQLLKEFEPKLDPYSNYWLCINRPINLN